jgi:serine/threonine-protein kinase HipA
VFQYAAEWLASPAAVPASLTLPLRPEPFVTDGLHPFFENLLPEGWLLELATKKLKIAKDDAFGLLLATCADCVGAVEIIPLPEGTDA